MSAGATTARPAPAAATARDPWIGGLFGPDVWTASLPIESADPDALPPAEAALAARFAANRRREFAAGRQCARGLLAELGAGAPLLLVDTHRAPGWPAGIVGTISHGAGLCVVAVARLGAVRGLGVDVESDAPLGASVRRRVCTEGEERLLAGADEAEAGRHAKLLFGAKEAIFKCVHPLWQRPLGLRDVEVRLEPAAGRFRARALAAAGQSAGALVDTVEGFYAVRDGRVLAGATLRSPSGSPA